VTVSRLPVPAGSDFSLHNLPYGVTAWEGTGHPAVRIGDHTVDLTVLAGAGLLPPEAAELLGPGTLNGFLGGGRPVWQETRHRLVELLSTDAFDSIPAPAIRSVGDETLLLPFQPGDYVDFYSSLEHASNLGRMFRPDGDPLLPNWRHLPVGYHGRASSVVVSGTPVTRPRGQVVRGDAPPTLEPTMGLDIELEVGFVTGPGNPLGTPIDIDDAGDHIFGLVLVNDWSARDIQRWEYQPLGPFLGKSFATTVSPWVVPLDALTPFMVTPPAQDPAPLDYLEAAGDWGLDLELEVTLSSEAMRSARTAPQVISRTNFKHMYWTMAQQLAHATVNGTNVRPGDLYASGTVSGTESGQFGSLIELTWNGRDPITLPDGSARRFLEDGDEVVLRGWCEAEGVRVGFGECRGIVMPAVTMEAD
jgi:fumarylacetoacetase